MIQQCSRKAPRLVPNDANALQTKLVILLQTDQYASASEMPVMSPGGNSLSSSQQPSSRFERVYMLYLLHREQEAQDHLTHMSGSASGLGAQHLDAQLVSLSSCSVGYGTLRRNSVTPRSDTGNDFSFPHSPIHFSFPPFPAELVGNEI